MSLHNLGSRLRPGFPVTPSVIGYALGSRLRPGERPKFLSIPVTRFWEIENVEKTPTQHHRKRMIGQRKPDGSGGVDPGTGSRQCGALREQHSGHCVLAHERFGRVFVANSDYFRLFYQSFSDRLPEIHHTTSDELIFLALDFRCQDCFRLTFHKQTGWLESDGSTSPLSLARDHPRVNSALDHPQGDFVPTDNPNKT